MDKALLVGINRYAAAPLKGCVNDIIDMAEFLVEKCAFSKTSVRLIADERATTAEIFARLEWLVDGAQPGDRLFFHYSGHGAQMATRDHQGEIDGLDEVICPVDFDWRDEHAIRDKDFRRIFGSVPRGVEFVWVSDSCHSGDLSRDLPLPDTLVKLFPTPVDIQWRIESAVAKGFQPLTLTRVPEAAVNEALISGCHSEQTSADASFDGRPNGVLTYFLLQTLRAERGLEMPLADVHATVKAAVAATQRYRQVPGLEGSPDVIKQPFLASQKEAIMPINNCSGLITLQMAGLDATSKDSVAKAIQDFMPAIVENVMIATTADRARGCTVSAGASSNGTVSGSVTCTF